MRNDLDIDIAMPGADVKRGFQTRSGEEAADVDVAEAGDVARQRRTTRDPVDT